LVIDLARARVERNGLKLRHKSGPPRIDILARASNGSGNSKPARSSRAPRLRDVKA
jgi:hypothetical protein